MWAYFYVFYLLFKVIFKSNLAFLSTYCTTIYTNVTSSHTVDSCNSIKIMDSIGTYVSIDPEFPEQSGKSEGYCIRVFEDFEHLREEGKCPGFPLFLDEYKRSKSKDVRSTEDDNTSSPSSIASTAKIYKISKIYEFLQFEKFFYRNFLEEYPQHARERGQEIIAEIIADKSFVQPCTICSTADKTKWWTMTICVHFFHQDCLWSERSKQKCPSCYVPLGILHHVWGYTA